MKNQNYNVPTIDRHNLSQMRMSPDQKSLYA